MLVNYIGDPAHLFSGEEYERGIAEILLTGTNVANMSDYNERLLQKFYISGLTQPKDIIVLGSSRSMQLSSSLFPGRTFFNNSVSGASIEDYLAIDELYEQRHIRPSMVILGLDPWILNRNNDQTRWKSLEKEYWAWLKRAGLPVQSQGIFQSGNLLPGKYLEIISPAYFRASLRAIANQIEKPDTQTSYYPTNEMIADFVIKRSDGSLSYDSKTRSHTIPEVRQLALTYATGNNAYSLGQFFELDRDFEQQLEAFVTLLQADGVEVVFHLPPYHPETYRLLMTFDQYKIIVEAQDYFTMLAASKQIKIIGSYNPDDVSCDESDFDDGMHPKESCSIKIFAPQIDPSSTAR